MREKIAEILNKNGIENYGFCRFSDLKDNILNCRAKGRIPENSKTVICLLFPYKVKAQKPKNISRYAAVRDYHLICGEIIKKTVKELKEVFKNSAFEGFIDNSPINEVYAAAKGGLGVIGKNGLLINEKYGSYCFIGEIITDMEINTENKKIKSCIGCNKCIEMCPTGGILNKRECLSEITQKKGELSEKEKALIKKSGCLWGCDICQELCPMNVNTETTCIKEFIKSYRDEFNENEEKNERAYTWRGEGVIIRNFNILKNK